MFRVLRNRDFALAWSGGLISMIGTWALWIALPIHVYQLSGSAFATSAVVAAVVVPGVLLGSVAGIFVDRWNRKTTLVATNVLLAGSVLPLLLVGESTAVARLPGRFSSRPRCRSSPSRPRTHCFPVSSLPTT